MVDRKDLYPGAVVTVRGRIDGDVMGESVFVEFSPNASGYVSIADILSVEDRPLAVGDRVRCTFGDDAGLTGEIAHIRNELAWVDFGDNGDDLKLLEDLERAP